MNERSSKRKGGMAAAHSDHSPVQAQSLEGRHGRKDLVTFLMTRKLAQIDAQRQAEGADTNS